jgi:hypothetical protein
MDSGGGRKACLGLKNEFISNMKTTSSQLMVGGVIILTLVLIFAAAWRVDRKPVSQPSTPAVVAVQEQAPVPREVPESRSVVPLSESVEFGHQTRQHDPWRDATDPDTVWHQQREQARQTLIRYGFPALDPALEK